MNTSDLQELLLSTIPPWHFWFERPFKQFLDDGMSFQMYYCIQALRHHGDNIAMSEMARFARVPKQQMTKTVDKLAERGFVERVADPNDRRVIRLKITDAAQEYVQHFLEQDAAYYRELFDDFSEEEREQFYEALQTIQGSFALMLNRKLGGELPAPPQCKTCKRCKRREEHA